MNQIQNAIKNLEFYIISTSFHNFAIIIITKYYIKSVIAHFNSDPKFNVSITTFFSTVKLIQKANKYNKNTHRQIVNLIFSKFIKYPIFLLIQNIPKKLVLLWNKLSLLFTMINNSWLNNGLCNICMISLLMLIIWIHRIKLFPLLLVLYRKR